jgi:hypothetical protein
MPPQPFSNVNPKAGYVLLPLLEKRPLVALEIETCIATWAQTDSAANLLFLTLLGSNETIGAALFNSFESTSAKVNALRSVAVATHALFDALLRLIKSRQKVRDKIAHWLWGVSDEIPDGLVLVDPRMLFGRNATYMDKGRAGTALANDLMPSPDHVFVYRVDDLKRDAKDFYDLTMVIYLAQSLFMTPKSDSRRQGIFDRLSGDPLLASFVSQKSSAD